jgi:SAM-dependent methyltransferase
MFVDSSRWIRAALEGIELPRGATALDVGSSTLDYRTVEQPHVEENVMVPLRERGIDITHLDAKQDRGVDIVCDVDAARPESALQIGRFDLVLCAGLLSCVSDPANALRFVKRLVGENGWLVVSTPESYRRTLDPRDNMLRPTAAELVAMCVADGNPRFEPLLAESVRIDDRRYYRGLRSRLCWVPVAGRWWLPLPGFTERLRYPVSRLRWRESCALLKRVS